MHRHTLRRLPSAHTSRTRTTMFPCISRPTPPPTRITRPHTMSTLRAPASATRVANTSVPQLNTSTCTAGLAPSSGSSSRCTDRSNSASRFSGSQSSSRLKYCTYRRCDGVVSASTCPPRRSQHRCSPSDALSTHPSHASRHAHTVSVRPLPVYDLLLCSILHQAVHHHHVLRIVAQVRLHRHAHLQQHAQ